MFPSSNKVSFQHHNFKGTLRKTTSTPLGKKKNTVCHYLGIKPFFNLFHKLF